MLFCCKVDDNIPLRVMLLLMDEVFDLKERNQWLRRNIKNLLQQLIKATYGDTINRCDGHVYSPALRQYFSSLFNGKHLFLLHCRKIVDHVEYMTSPEQVSDYVKRFRWWLHVYCLFWNINGCGSSSDWVFGSSETLIGRTGFSPRRRHAETKASVWGRGSPPKPHSWASCQVLTMSIVESAILELHDSG